MTPETKRSLYESMLRIRKVEERIADEYSKQQMRCPVHLSIGQEAPPTGICAHLNAADRIFSNHRCHAHYVAKGGSLDKMIAELHGKNTGCAKGKGGSMHLVDVEQGMMGASALVAGTIPLSVGAAFSMKVEKSDRVAVAFFGDGASEEGLFYESLNFAAFHKLPVLFACENNNYATYSEQKARQAHLDITERGRPFGMPSFHVDGNDCEAIYEKAGEAVERARRGEGPTLFEFVTSRWRDHVGPGWDYEPGHRTKEDVEQWMTKCPIKKIEASLKNGGELTDEQRTQIHADLDKEVDHAFEFALASPLPKPSELFEDIYC